MDTTTAFSGLDWAAVIAAAVAAFVAGAIWFGPLFGKAWVTGFGFGEEELGEQNKLKIFGLTLVLNLIMAINLAMFLGADPTIGFGVAAGFATGLGFAAPLIGVYYLFEGRPMKLFLINGGFAVVNFTVMGAVIPAI